jgi:hypothetical protein
MVHAMSMYQASVPVFVQMLNALSGILGKAESFATEHKVEASVLLNYRLSPDMFPLARQVQTAADFAKDATARLAGVEFPKFENTEASFAELKARIAKTLDYIGGFKPAQIDGSEEREVTLTLGGNPVVFKGQPYLMKFVLPNFFFHCTTAYGIARHCGVAVGKRDFLGAFR